jgi:hypothetical protein
MLKLLQYYGRYQSARGVLSDMPGWARLILLIAALPGLVLAALSLLVLGVSILALLLLTVPLYRVLKGLTGSGSQDEPVEEVPPAGQVDFVEPAEPVQLSVAVSEVPPPAQPQRERRQIEVRIIE